MARALVYLKMVMSTKVNCVMDFYTEKELLNGLTAPFIKVSSEKTKLLAKELITGLMEAPIKVR